MRNNNKEAFDGIIQKLSQALEPIKFKRKSAKKARLKLIKLQADKYEGLLPDLSPDMRKLRPDTERALATAWSEGHVDSYDSEIEERKLAVRRMRELIPAAKAAESEADAKLRAAQEAAKVRVSADLASRIGNEEQKIRELEKERRGYLDAAEQIAAGVRPKFWEPGSGELPPIQPGESKESHQARCRAERLHISIAELHELESNHEQGNYNRLDKVS